MKTKFRAWDYDEKRMHDVLVIDWLNGLVDSDFGNIEKPFGRVELMQYTGLNDKDGVEVYFNDIVEDEYGHRYEVVFEGDCLRCNGVRKIRGGYKPKNRWFGRGLKIIGNIYESPELLEVAE